jgi:oxygen-independent coproporphyrinogen-3 oxidase
MRTGLPIEAVAAPLREAQARGWLIDDPGRLQATSLGRRFLNDLIEEFLPPRPPERRHA